MDPLGSGEPRHPLHSCPHPTGTLAGRFHLLNVSLLPSPHMLLLGPCHLWFGWMQRPPKRPPCLRMCSLKVCAQHHCLQSAAVKHNSGRVPQPLKHSSRASHDPQGTSRCLSWAPKPGFPSCSCPSTHTPSTLPTFLKHLGISRALQRQKAHSQRDSRRLCLQRVSLKRGGWGWGTTREHELTQG